MAVYYGTVVVFRKKHIGSKKKCVTLRRNRMVETVTVESVAFEDISSLETEINSKPSNWDETYMEVELQGTNS
jgi:hypothetical protein